MKNSIDVGKLIKPHYSVVLKDIIIMEIQYFSNISSICDVFVLCIFENINKKNVCISARYKKQSQKKRKKYFFKVLL